MVDQITTLAEFIRNAREKVGLSVSGLSKKTGVDEEVIYDIESAKDLFLSVPVRQKLAKGLKINPSEIKKYERTLELNYNADYEFIEDVKRKVRENRFVEIKCPICNSILDIKAIQRYDIDDNPVIDYRIHCPKCPFQIK